MDLDELIISMYVRIDDELKIATHRLNVNRLRERGPAPKLHDAEVLTMECVGELLGIDCDKHLHAYFTRHYRHFFPALLHTDRSTFARQGANLWHLKQLIWKRVIAEVAPADDRLHMIDSMPVPVCRFARANFSKLFRGSAWYGKDHTDRQTFYGFRFHARVTWPGFISEFFVLPANGSEQSAVPHLAGSAPEDCAILGDRNYCVPELKKQLAQDRQYLLTPPARQAKNDPEPGKPWRYGNLRYLIETVFGQLTDRLHLKNVRARDLWHLTCRIYRKVLAHTLAVMINMERGNPPLQLEMLVAA